MFCNISGSTLTDGSVFPQLLEFLEANCAICSSIALESAKRAAVGRADRASRSQRSAAIGSHRNVTDLRFSRATCSPAASVTSRRRRPAQAGPGHGDIVRPTSPTCSAARDRSHRRADRGEGSVVDLLECGVRLARALFPPPRPVRAEALQGIADRQPAGDVPRAAGHTGARESRGVWRGRDGAPLLRAEPDRAAHLMRPRRSSMDGSSCP